MTNNTARHKHHWLRKKLYLYIFTGTAVFSILFILLLPGYAMFASRFLASKSTQDTAPENTASETGLQIGTPVFASGGRKSIELSLVKNKFVPDSINVNEYDIVSIRLVAGDEKFVFSIPAFGIIQEANKNEGKIAEFQTSGAGKYEYICVSCKKEVKGTLIVSPKQNSTTGSKIRLNNILGNAAIPS